ncbi:MAG: arsenate reductase ArsC [Guyparkeria sp.]
MHAEQYIYVLAHTQPGVDCHEGRARRGLFACIHNSGRSQMAEAYLNALDAPTFRAESAGLEPRPIDSLVVEVMAEDGFDLPGASSDDIFALYREGRLYERVIYVCERAAERNCPVFPGVRRALHWPFPDPQRLAGSMEERLVALREIRDRIRKRGEA